MRRRKTELAPGEPNVLPVMNVMFLLIPALLLAMETASMAAVNVSAPRYVTGPESAPGPTDKALEFSLQLRSDGILATIDGVDEPLMGLVSPTDPSASGARFDWVALEALASELHAKHPLAAKVKITAEKDVEYGSLIAAMDALRGSECSWPDAREAAPETCLFWAPTIESR